jgi:hypothetical protein
VKDQAIQKKIIDKLYLEGHSALNLITASKAGFSDVLSCSPFGLFWSVEVKRLGEKPSKIQLYRLAQFEKRGAIAFWCDSYEDFLVKFNDGTIREANRQVTLVD